MRKLLFDTNFIVAYVLASDAIHQRAIDLEDKEDILNNELYITNHIIDEVVTIIGQKASPKDAIDVYRLMKDNFIIINEYEVFDFNDKVMSRYNNMNDSGNQRIGFTDCSIIEVAKLYDLDAVVTFDKAFEENGDIEIIS